MQAVFPLKRHGKKNGTRRGSRREVSSRDCSRQAETAGWHPCQVGVKRRKLVNEVNMISKRSGEGSSRTKHEKALKTRSTSVPPFVYPFSRPTGYPFPSKKTGQIEQTSTIEGRTPVRLRTMHSSSGCPSANKRSMNASIVGLVVQVS